MPNNSFMDLSNKRFDACLCNANLVRLRICQADIASGRVGHLVDQLMQLSDTLEGVLNWKDKLIIRIELPHTEQREASEIPEVVHYFQVLTSQWPFWLHFAEKTGGTVGTVLRLLIGTEHMQLPATQQSLNLTDAFQVRSKAKWLYGQIKHLYRCHALPESEDTQIAVAIVKAVNAMFHKT